MDGLDTCGSFMSKALPGERVVDVHVQASKLQEELALAGQPVQAPQPPLLGQPEVHPGPQRDLA